jgi:hypothetical protein
VCKIPCLFENKFLLVHKEFVLLVMGTKRNESGIKEVLNLKSCNVGRIAELSSPKCRAGFLGFCSSSTLGNFFFAFCDGGICAGLV